MAELSQFLNTGSVKTVSLQEGSFVLTTTGVKLTVSVSSTQKAILTPGLSGTTGSAAIAINFGARTIYTGTPEIFLVSGDSETYRNQSLVGGKGEDLTISLSTAGSGVINYFVQVVEID